jgi:hypothetical protein
VSPGEEAFLWVQKHGKYKTPAVGASENLRNATIRSIVSGLLWALDVDIHAERTE